MPEADEDAAFFRTYPMAQTAGSLNEIAGILSERLRQMDRRARAANARADRAEAELRTSRAREAAQAREAARVREAARLGDPDLMRDLRTVQSFLRRAGFETSADVVKRAIAAIEPRPKP